MCLIAGRWEKKSVSKSDTGAAAETWAVHGGDAGEEWLVGGGGTRGWRRRWRWRNGRRRPRNLRLGFVVVRGGGGGKSRTRLDTTQGRDRVTLRSVSLGTSPRLEPKMMTLLSWPRSSAPILLHVPGPIQGRGFNYSYSFPP
jgi:hypothetical protein